MKVVNGIIVEAFQKGWQEDGHENLPVPFNIEDYFVNGRANITLSGKKTFEVSFTKTDGLFEFSCGNTQLKKPMKLYREWKNESLEMIMWLESVAIGDCTRKVLQGEKLLD